MVEMNPQPGDVVVDSDGRRYVIDSSYFGEDMGSGPIVLATHPSMGPAYRDNGGVAVSGGPCPFVPLAKLTYNGTIEQPFWKFRNGVRRAGNAETYTMTVSEFAWNQED
jgi:signal peptidase I